MASKTFTLKRSVCASPALVYMSFTNATALREWFCDLALVQPFVGGRIYCQWDDGSALMGRYVALTPLKKVAFVLRGDEDGSEVAVTAALAEKDNCTALTLTLSGEGRANSKHLAQEEARWNAALDNLVSVLETGVDQRAAARPSLGLDVSSNGIAAEEGVRVVAIHPNSPASEAGIQVGDVLLSLGNTRMVNEQSLSAALQQRKVGDKLKVDIARNGHRFNAAITLGSAVLDVPRDHEVLAEIVARKYTEVNRDLTQALKNVSDERAARVPLGGRWSVRHVLAHLIEGERYIHHWITCLINAEEPLQDYRYSPTLRERLDAVINGFPTVQALLTELKRNEAETVALLNALPAGFLARKASARRLAETMLVWPDHAREHIEEIRRLLKLV